jgi:transposase
MIQITPHMRILVAVEPIDFRAGIDTLAAHCRKRLQADPFGGTLFVFANRARTAIKVLVYDGQGFWMCHKRLSTGKFAWWPAEPENDPTHDPTHERAHGRTLQACELQVLLMAGNPTQAQAAPAWRALRVAA